MPCSTHQGGHTACLSLKREGGNERCAQDEDRVVAALAIQTLLTCTGDTGLS